LSDDNITSTDNGTYYTLNKSVIDEGNVSVTESLTSAFYKFVDNTDSTVTFTESGNGVLLNYTDVIGPSGYFLEYYVGEEVITIS
jgi:hypothetical protein